MRWLPPALSLPSLGVSSLDLGRLWQNAGGLSFLCEVPTASSNVRVRGEWRTLRGQPQLVANDPKPDVEGAQEAIIGDILAAAQEGHPWCSVTAQFIDAETGAHLWADQFDADRADLLEMQDAIVTRLSRAFVPVHSCRYS
jgi:hypothetical protein